MSEKVVTITIKGPAEVSVSMSSGCPDNQSTLYHTWVDEDGRCANCYSKVSSLDEECPNCGWEFDLEPR